ncbi:facilitated trehalose transporter Tret1-like isoform X1 [Daktulosphaira vitifoliae]|uniref:facilitated trehalose transporter Tret1-like isoform X1 n=1 Tax=Daktulosphaira vitifoliae TaxID=58002 RepID=UPI0021AA61E9|nr:facilitated trehalose transporter Tret1-like isoform X1 [Daktulosphaira vitifoliae]XP_050534185.1 facilitated trehalose transporter Tret1-like isoform X1 [Daktulosphaira vitifoliae]XP_050534186.1 facilitated trehalose transporter Tret1-like isoform X1 [Daktulosphaira vitifoliae]XP_050534187.1 facilitated trehalose transporter Tret1-like isoform X1 [Daktulosphaira vitifoliae]XP_050534188.1 facilitated trehalose transporter Tret1-like isoform X1 [Daktulosphaira vitifoliae]XP_050534189.1 facil
MKEYLDEFMYNENVQLLRREDYEFTSGCRNQILASFLASLMSFASGTVVAVFSDTKVYKDDNEIIIINEEQYFWIISSCMLGAFFGSIQAGVWSQMFGPKKLLLWLSAPMICGWLFILLNMNNVIYIYVGRLICGFSLGAASVVIPLYSHDVSSVALKGRTGVFFNFMSCAGILFTYITRSFWTGLQESIVILAIIPFVFVAIFSWMPESPTYLYCNGQYYKAIKALRWLRGNYFNIKKEFSQYEICQFDTIKFQMNFNLAYDRQITNKVILISFGLVLIQKLTGVIGLLHYTVIFFEVSKIDTDIYMTSIVFGVFQLTASWIAFLLIDKVGRRTLLLISSFICTICLAIISIYLYLLADDESVDFVWRSLFFIIVCGLISAFQIGLGPIPWFIVTEILPSKKAAHVQSMAVSFSWLLSFLILMFFQFFIKNYASVMWLTFTIFSAIGFLFIALFVPETNNRNHEQIEAELFL